MLFLCMSVTQWCLIKLTAGMYDHFSGYKSGSNCYCTSPYKYIGAVRA